MAISIDDLATVEAKGIDAFQVRKRDKDLGPKGFFGITARAVAMTVWGFLQAAKGIDNDSVPSSASSDAAVDAWAYAEGVPSNRGGFGRNGPEVATGGLMTITGAPGTVYTDGSSLVGSDGVTFFELSGNVTLDGTGSFAGASVIALSAGSSGNYAANLTLSWVSPPAGSDGTTTLTTGLSGGLDQETTQALLERIFQKAQFPPKGGAEPDYIVWALSQSGVFKVYEYPLRSGTGTVDVVITAAGNARGRQASADLVATVQSYIDSVRPVACEAATVLAPYMPANSAKPIEVRVVPSATKFNFDWNDLAGPMTVKASGTTTLLRINGAPLAALVTAFAASTSTTRPRIQVASTNINGAAEQRRVTAIDTTTINPDTILTLDSPLSNYPTAGDAVWAGGPVVAAIATAIDDHVGSLGPSRKSGYGDSVQPWQDTIEYLQIVRLALEATDTTGVKMISNLVTLPLVNGSAADLQGDDNGNGPELLYAGPIVVRQ